MTAATYRIEPVDPAGHLFEVVLTVHAPAPTGQLLRLPAWIPGSYTVRDMAKHVVRLEARRDGRPVALQ
ncbi:MAG: M61 family peptidase, partial [Myxococcales bacterium]|nr:M61 family peptidase [Myxococcales bacterium]